MKTNNNKKKVFNNNKMGKFTLLDNTTYFKTSVFIQLTCIQANITTSGKDPPI